MSPAIASVVLSAIAILVSIFGTIRIARNTARLQEWNYRQKVGEELNALANLLTQSELLTQREQHRNAMAEREAKRLLLRAPNDARIVSTLADIEASKVVAGDKINGHAQLRKSLAVLLQTDKPTADQLAEVQRMQSTVQRELMQLQELEPKKEDWYKAFMASAAQVP